MSARTPEQIADEVLSDGQWTALERDGADPGWVRRLIERAVLTAQQERRAEQFAIVANATGDAPSIIGYYESRWDAQLLAQNWNLTNGDVATYTVEPGEDW